MNQIELFSKIPQSKEEIKFRSSSFWKLMVEPKAKSESLSETTKTYLEELYIENEYGRRKDYKLKYCEKGNIQEELGIKLLSEIDGIEYKKNTSHLENEYIQGTPDLINPSLIDIKTSWDIWTFKNSELKKEYYWQLQCYMWMLGLTDSTLVYTLVDTPEYLISNEQKKAYNELYYKEGVVLTDKEVAKMYTEIHKNLTVNEIPKEIRIKKFHCEFNEANIEKMINKIELSRKYYKTITL